MLPTTGPDYFKKSVHKPYLVKLIENLTVRFEDKSTITAFDVFNPASMPSDAKELQEYGNSNIQNLSEHYHPYGVLGGPQDCLTEWSSCRQFLQDNHFKKHSEVIQYLCTSPTMLQLYPNISTMAQICRVIPIHSADVERTFSQLKLIKTNIRNRMIEKTLDALLRIAIEGPKLEDFPFRTAVSLWARKKNRRIRY